MITFVVAASGLKYVGVGTTALGWLLCAMLFAGAAVWLFYVRPAQKAGALEECDGEIPQAAESAAAEPTSVN
jgi:hypothetical protein